MSETTGDCLKTISDVKLNEAFGHGSMIVTIKFEASPVSMSFMVKARTSKLYSPVDYLPVK